MKTSLESRFDKLLWCRKQRIEEACGRKKIPVEEAIYYYYYYYYDYYYYYYYYRYYYYFL